MAFWATGSLAFILFVALVLLYIRVNDKQLTRIPNEVLAFSPKRCTPESVRSLSARLSQSPPISIHEQLPPKTGRRYIIVGGGGFLGGWIVYSLLERGEDPKCIRMLDLRPPVREDLTTGIAKNTQFIQVDVSDSAALHAAFSAPWPNSHGTTTTPEITIFHTAANIRFYERHKSLLPASERVNVKGTENVIDAARAIGASILIYTSSGSVGIRRSHFFLSPWQKEPKHYVQIINDDERLLPQKHEEFFSNYAVTKMRADRLVRAADRTPSGKDGSGGVLRTGCIRPGNGVFGPRGDMFCGAYLVRGTNPTWVANTMQSFCYVENCALAHLCYEQRLIELRNLGGGRKTMNPDIGGQAFVVADPGPVQTYGDVYTCLETMTDGECTFPNLPPTLMLIVAYMIEAYCLTRHSLVNSRRRCVKMLAERLLPPIDGDVVNLQPSLFALISVHLIFDDSRARLPPEKGGLGYKGAWTTLEGISKTVEEHQSGIGRSGRRSELAGISLGFGMGKAQRAVARANEKVVDGIGIDPVKILSTQVDL